MSAKKILLFGLSGAGKDTQAERLAAHFGLQAFSIGTILRSMRDEPTQWREEIQHSLVKGSLVSAETAHAIMKHRLLHPNTQSTGYTLTGYPRELRTAEGFLTFEVPTHAILLTLPREVAAERLERRGRPDDTTELVQRRVDRFFETELPVWELLRKDQRVICIEVDATRSVEEITANLITQLRG